MKQLSKKEAQKLTAEVRRDAAALWNKLLRLYEGGAHAALGYAGWHEYCRVEFGYGKAHSYRLLAAGRVERAVSLHVETREMTEAQARLLQNFIESGPDYGEPSKYLLQIAARVKDEGGWAAVSVKRLREIMHRAAGVSPRTPQDEPLWFEYRMNSLARAITGELRIIDAHRDEVAVVVERVSPRSAKGALNALAKWREEVDRLEVLLSAGIESGGAEESVAA